MLESNTFLQYTPAVDNSRVNNYYQEEQYYERNQNGNRSYGFKGLY